MTNIVAIIQARQGSSRLPGKSMMKLTEDYCVLDFMIQRLMPSIRINKIVVATTHSEEDDTIEDLCNALGIACFRGSERNVLERFYQAAVKYKASHIVRLTGDCPLQDYRVVDDLINGYFDSSVDCVANAIFPTYPDGFDAEMFSFLVLEKVFKLATLPSEKEHVTPYIYKKSSPFIYKNIPFIKDYSHFRLTLDTKEDFQLIQIIALWMSSHKTYIHLPEILNYIEKNPELLHINNQYRRNEGYEKSLHEDSDYLDK